MQASPFFLPDSLSLRKTLVEVKGGEAGASGSGLGGYAFYFQWHLQHQQPQVPGYLVIS